MQTAVEYQTPTSTAAGNIIRLCVNASSMNNTVEKGYVGGG